MTLDGIILHKCAEELRKRLPIRINRISECSNTTLVFNIHSENERRNLVMSFHSVTNRISLSDRNYSSTGTPGGFLMLLRKYLINGFITSVEQNNFDRYLLLHIHARDELYDERHFLLSVELMGKYANLILVDEDTGKIMDALKRIPPCENSGRIVLAGVPFEPVAPQAKQNPFYPEETICFDESLVKQIAGFSKLLETEIRYRMAHGERFEDILSFMEKSQDLYITECSQSYEYHILPLKHLQKKVQKRNLFEGLEEVYFEQEEKSRRKDAGGSLYKFIKREQKHYLNKIQKLQQSYQDSLNLETEAEAGNLLYTYGNLHQKGLKECRVSDGEGNERVIPVNPRFSIKENAQKYFQLYQKKRKGKAHILAQLSLAEAEAEYFDSLAEQLEFADAHDLEVMRDELIKNGYLREKKEPRNKGKKTKEKEIRLYQIHQNGHRILFGKNNLQNDYLTFKVAKSTDTWFHAKDFHGAHVLVDTPDPDEETLRLCAEIAAYYSRGRYSSSVPVDYTLAKNVRKIKGAKPGFVSLIHQKTIYIDPRERKDLSILSF